MIVELNEQEYGLLKKFLAEQNGAEYEIRVPNWSRGTRNQSIAAKKLCRSIELLIADKNDDITGDYKPEKVGSNSVWRVSADLLSKMRVELKGKNWPNKVLYILKYGQDVTEEVLG